jgi:lipopolysaccharide transport system permease protein
VMKQLFFDIREMVTEQVEFHELLWQIVRRDLRLRYKQTVMGFGWAIFMPLLNMVIFSIIFTRVAPLDAGSPYPVFAYAGLLPWNFLASSLRFSAASLTNNTNLITKVYFPREILPFAAIVVSLVDFAVAASVLVCLMAYFHIWVSWAVLCLPLIVAVQIVFTAGVSLLVAMGQLFFRDIKYLFEVLLSVWMFASPVVYPVDRIGGHLGTLLRFNPMTPIIESYRAVLLRGELPAAGPLLWVALFSFGMLVWSWVVFHRSEFRFAENV